MDQASIVMIERLKAGPGQAEAAEPGWLVPDESFSRSCSRCAKKEPFLNQFQRCGHCRVAVYCSRECQAADWKQGHREKLIQAVAQHV